MKEHISIKQMAFLFLFISITPILSYIPKNAAIYGGNSGYICTFFYGVILCAFAGLLLNIAKACPGKSFYEILSSIAGTILAKMILFLYGIWSFCFAIYKISSYSLLLKTTLMPDTADYITVASLFLLVLYTLLKGTKTIFRVAELLYRPVLFCLFLLFIYAFASINKAYLAPVSFPDVKSNVLYLKSIGAVGGNLFLLLFYLKQITRTTSYSAIKKQIFRSVAMFTLFSCLAVILSIGISGSSLTGKYNYSLFQTIKSISLLQSFQRFDSFITIFCTFSDFIAICIFTDISIQCFSEAAEKNRLIEAGAILLATGCIFVIIKNITLYEMNTIYQNWMDTINLIFQYGIPIILGIIFLFKKKSSKNV